LAEFVRLTKVKVNV
jgi:hypothetical protein